MEEIKLEFNGIEYRIKQSFRALGLFEVLSNKHHSEINTSMNDLMMIFYSILKTGNKSFTLDYETFQEELDNNTDAFNLFILWLFSGISELVDKQEPEPEDKKKE